MNRSRTLLVLMSLIALLAAACGGDDSPTDGDARTIDIEMVDIAFEPVTVEVTQGETVRFVFTNTGDTAHDAFIGDADAQTAHEADMREADEGHGSGHDEDDDEAVTVEPGETGELSHTFDTAGAVEIGCHQPGHYEAGMRLAIDAA